MKNSTTTGLGTAPPEREMARSHGYAIISTDSGYLFLFTTRSNRHDAWQAFSDRYDNRRWKRLKCVPVVVREYQQNRRTK